MDENIEKLNNAYTNYFAEVRAQKNFSWRGLYENMEPAFKVAGYREEGEDKYARILVISLNAMGDHIIYGALVKKLRQLFPKAYITWLTRAGIAELIRYCPYVNDIIAVADEAKEEPIRFIAGAQEILCKYLWPRHYTACLMPQWNPDILAIPALGFMSGAAVRVGFSDKAALNFGARFDTPWVGDGYLTHDVITPVEAIAEVDRGTSLLLALGFRPEITFPEIWYNENDFKTAKTFIAQLKPGRKLAAIGIGAGADSRKYPKEKYLAVMKKLLEKDYRYIIVGGKTEAADGDFLVNNLPDGAAVNAAGKNSYRETCALISLADIYIGNDSGVMHAAAACDIPIVEVSREAAGNKYINARPGVFSELRRFAPYTKAPHVAVTPSEQLGECGKAGYWGGCRENYSHCIASIEPLRIVQATDMVEQAPQIPKRKIMIFKAR